MNDLTKLMNERNVYSERVSNSKKWIKIYDNKIATIDAKIRDLAFSNKGKRMKPKKTVPERYFMMYLTGRMDALTAFKYIEGYRHILRMHQYEGEHEDKFFKRLPEIKAKLDDCAAQILEITKRENARQGDFLPPTGRMQ